MADQENREATWQSPEREGRGGSQNPPGDKGQDRTEAGGQSVERSGWSHEARQGPGYPKAANQAGSETPTPPAPHENTNDSHDGLGGGGYGGANMAGFHQDVGWDGPPVQGAWQEAPGDTGPGQQTDYEPVDIPDQEEPNAPGQDTRHS